MEATTPGVVPLRRCALRLWEMTGDRAPFEGTVTARELPSQNEVQWRVVHRTGVAHIFWPPPVMLPMLPAEVTVELVYYFSISF